MSVGRLLVYIGLIWLVVTWAAVWAFGSATLWILIPLLLIVLYAAYVGWITSAVVGGFAIIGALIVFVIISSVFGPGPELTPQAQELNILGSRSFSMTEAEVQSIAEEVAKSEVAEAFAEQPVVADLEVVDLAPLALEAGEVLVVDSYFKANAVTVFEPAEGWDAWFASQVFSETVNQCNPHTYDDVHVWWIESSAEDGARNTGGDVEEFDILLTLAEQVDPSVAGRTEIAVAWGNDVIVNGIDYGQALVIMTGPGRFHVTIDNGAYRIGLDLGGHFPDYWDKVLTCLYPHGNWTPVYHPTD